MITNNNNNNVNVEKKVLHSIRQYFSDTFNLYFINNVRLERWFYGFVPLIMEFLILFGLCVPLLLWSSGTVYSCTYSIITIMMTILFYMTMKYLYLLYDCVYHCNYCYSYHICTLVNVKNMDVIIMVIIVVLVLIVIHTYNHQLI